MVHRVVSYWKKCTYPGSNWSVYSNGDAMKTATKALLALLLTYKGGRCHVVDGETPSAKDAEMMMQVNALLEIQQLLHETNFGSAIISAIQVNFILICLKYHD